MSTKVDGFIDNLGRGDNQIGAGKLEEICKEAGLYFKQTDDGIEIDNQPIPVSNGKISMKDPGLLHAFKADRC